MTGRQLRETEKNIRSEEFLTTNIGDFQGIVMATQMIAELTTRVANVQSEYQKQIKTGGEARQGYEIVRDCYDELRAEMVSVRNFSKTISRKIEGLDELFRLPAGSGRRNLVAAARVFAENAETHKQKFLDAGMDEDFITDLNKAADHLENALNNAASSTGERVGATDMVGIEVDAANDIVDDMDPIVRRVYRNNPAKLAQWDFVSKVERHTAKPRVPKPPTE